MTIGNPTTAPPVTLAEYAALPKHPRYELVKGELVEIMGATFGHEETISLTNAQLVIHVYPARLGSVYGSNATYVTEPGERPTARMPDLSFVSAGRNPEAGTTLFYGAPDLAVEVLSDSNTPAEIAQKIAEYLNAGGKAVWVIDIDARTLTVHTADAPPLVLTDADTVDGGDYLPGFNCAVADLLRAP